MERSFNYQGAIIEVAIIHNPRYTVDFAQYLPKKKEEDPPSPSSLTLFARINQYAVAYIDCVSGVVTTVYRSGCVCRTHIVSSFKRLVFQCMGLLDPYFMVFQCKGLLDLHFMVFKVTVWACYSGIFAFKTVVFDLVKFFSSYLSLPTSFDSRFSSYLELFSSQGIDFRHIQAIDNKLDASAVPSDIQVDSLLSLFDAINFDKPEEPGYMSLAADQSAGNVESKAKLRETLKTFIKQIRGRVPLALHLHLIIGTPPAHEQDRVNTFYQQIEDAARLSLHKLVTTLAQFKEIHPDLNMLDADALKTYSILLADQARFVIDCAVAGQHCAVRYLAEVMSSYFRICGASAAPSETMEGTLLQILAEKRYEIAQEEAQRYAALTFFNTKNSSKGDYGASAHRFSEYMQHMGTLLALPGTAHIINGLSRSFDYASYVKSFFSIYTENFIINAVQETIKSSQPFREQIIDWLKTKVHPEWAPKILSKQQKILRKLEEVQKNPVDVTETMQDVQFLADQLRLNGHEVSREEGWRTFLQEFFVLKKVKAALNETYALENETIMAQRRKKEAIFQKLAQGPLGEALNKQYQEKNSIVLDETLQNLIRDVVVAEKMQAVLPVEKEVLLRMLRGDSNAEEVVRGYLEGRVTVAFLGALDINGMAENGLSPVLMEWLLNDHHVFVPRVLDQQQIKFHSINDPQARWYRNMIDPDNLVAQYQEGDPSVVQQDLPPFLSQEFDGIGSKRYIFGLETDVKKISYQVFEKAFEENQRKIVLRAESMMSSKTTIYPLWKTVMYIMIPEKGVEYFKNSTVKVFRLGAIALVISLFTYQLYNQTGIWVSRFNHTVETAASLRLIKVYRLFRRSFLFVMRAWTAFATISRPFPIGRILIQLLIRYMIQTQRVQGATRFILVHETLIEPIIGMWRFSTTLAYLFQHIADCAKAEKMRCEKQYCRSLWNHVIQNTPVE